MKVTITVHQTSYPEKPGNLECATQIRKSDQNELREVNVYELAMIVKKKHSFYLGMHKLDFDQSVDLSKETFIQQQAFAIDVDHGNFSVEEILERFSGLPIEPCLIYKTFSYKEPHDRRWRVVFFADLFYTDISAITSINEYLMYVMGHDFRDYGYEWVKKLDLSAKDCARIYFAGLDIAHLKDVQPANFEFIFDDELDEKVQNFKLDLRKAKKELKEASEGVGGNSDTKTDLKPLYGAKNAKKEVVLTEANDPKALAEKIIGNLEMLSMILPNKPQTVDYRDAYTFVDDLPLAMLLGVEVEQMFNCVLPNHDDSTPSAHIILDEKTEQQVYHCFGCCVESYESYRAFSVIAHIFEAAFGYSLMETLSSIYNVLEIQLGSLYQQKVRDELHNAVHMLDNAPADDLFNQLLVKKKVKGFYKAFLMMGVSKTSFASMKKESENDELVFFASNSYIQHYVQQGWNISGCTHLSSVNRKINYLVKLGLLDKVDYNDLNQSVITRLEGYISDTNAREERLTGKKYKRNPDYYQINFLKPSVIERALKIASNDAKLHARSTGQGKAQVTAIFDAKKGKEIYRQSKEGWSKKEKLFLKMSVRVAFKLLSENKYFTEDDLIKKVDAKGNHWKKSEKIQLSQKLLPYLMKSFGLQRKRVSKELRKELNVSDKLTYRHFIFFTELEKEKWDLSLLNS